MCGLNRRYRLSIALLAVMAVAIPVYGQSAPTQPTTIDGEDIGTLQILMTEIDRLTSEVDFLRQQLKDSRSASIDAMEELEELRQFTADHHQFGQDFQEYRELKKAREVEVRREKAESLRIQREARKAERIARAQTARAARERKKAASNRMGSYREDGFESLGLDVFLGKIAYSYRPIDTTSGIGYGFGMRYFPGINTDFSRMTLSGSILNASRQTRDVGVAVTFFDEFGNQVGHETVQISNARPNVPYPFTSSIEMALNRPFASSSQYVLFADASQGGP